ncbi:MAG: protein translocase subunit SecD [Terriglobia bacterium]|jgi:preprotein translocase subunit SecD
METKIRGRAIFILIVVVACLLGIIGFPKNVQELKDNVHNRIHLGLDLKGGTNLVLQVQVEDAVNITSGETLERLKDELKAKNVPYADCQSDDDKTQNPPSHRILIKGIPQDRSADLQTVASGQFSDWDLVRVPGDETARLLVLKTSAAAIIRNQALMQAMDTIRRRVDALGVTEPTIAEYGQGDFELVVQLPGVDDPSRVKDIMQSTALLELKLVQDGPYSSREAALAAHGGVLPPDTELVPGTDEQTHNEVWYVLNRIAAVTGRDLSGAEPSHDQAGRPSVNFTLNRDGAERFGRVTGANIGKLLAIVLDNRVYSAPSIHGQITDRGEITGGNFTPQTAQDLALVLRSGALPASIKYLSEETVGPSLGADSIRHGVIASIVGLLAVMGFMLVYYRGSGVNADLALVLNLLILIAALVDLKLFAILAVGVLVAWVVSPIAGAIIAAVGLLVTFAVGAPSPGTFTLPGIAGVILTVGMGVDSNVLIFERIREELRLGKAVGAAVAAGFEQAFRTIIDTHVTTIVSAAILFAFGTGPIQGFAVTLTIGLLANLFTSVFVSRVIFDYGLTQREKGAVLSI